MKSANKPYIYIYMIRFFREMSLERDDTDKEDPLGSKPGGMFMSLMKERPQAVSKVLLYLLYFHFFN